MEDGAPDYPRGTAQSTAGRAPLLVEKIAPDWKNVLAVVTPEQGSDCADPRYYGDSTVSDHRFHRNSPEFHHLVEIKISMKHWEAEGSITYIHYLHQKS